MIATIIIIFCVVVFMAVAYNTIVSHGDGLGNKPTERGPSWSNATYYGDPDYRVGQCTPDRHCTPTAGHIATPAEREASHREYHDRKANALINDWQARLEREIREGRKQ